MQRNLAGRPSRPEAGSSVTEYGMVLGFIAITVSSAIQAAGASLVEFWTWIGVQVQAIF